jgi:Spy/CpxP family protein refolding chaperone
MKSKKRFAVVAGAAGIIMVLMGLGIAEAFGGGFHPCHRFGRDMPAFMLKRLDKKVEELKLTPDQKAKYDELRGQLKANFTAAKEDREKFRETVRTELAKESPDIAALTGMMKKKVEGFSANVQNDLDLFASFYSTLDKDQQKKVTADISKRMAAMDKCRGEKK